MRNHKVISMILVVIASLMLSTRGVAVMWEEVIYFATDAVVVGWNELENAESFEVVAVWSTSGGPRQEFIIGETTELQMEVKRPRGGFFHIKVRGKNDEFGPGPWCESTNPECASVDGQPRGWRVFFEIPAPTGGGVI